MLVGRWPILAACAVPASSKFPQIRLSHMGWNCCSGMFRVDITYVYIYIYIYVHFLYVCMKVFMCTWCLLLICICLKCEGELCSTIGFFYKNLGSGSNNSRQRLTLVGRCSKSAPVSPPSPSHRSRTSWRQDCHGKTTKVDQPLCKKTLDT